MRSTVLFLVLSCLYSCQGNPKDSPSTESQVSLQGTGVQDGLKSLGIIKDEIHNASQKAPSSKKLNSPAKMDDKTGIKMENETKLDNLGKNVSEKLMINETEMLVEAVKTNNKTVNQQLSVNQLETHHHTLKTEEVNKTAGNKTDEPKPDNRREKLKEGEQPDPKSISDQEKENAANAEQQRPESKEKTTENETPGENEGNDGNEEEVMNSADKRGGQASPPSQPEEESSHFFAYFIFMALLVATLYVGYHNKRKIIAFVLEGRRSRAPRRPKSSDYQKLDQH